jgi:peptidoglycan/LPS O-acetylase OafA/YrhL
MLRMKRLPALDVLRGIAILMVLIHHYVPENMTIPLLWSGVDMFFVLSGFLISGILLDNAGAVNYFSAFYLRRAARILPLYWIVLLIFGALLVLNPELLGASFQRHLPFWSYITFTQNFAYSFRGFWRDPWLDVTWSLALEEQFYVFLSIAVRFLKAKWLAALSVVLILLAPILRFYSEPMAGYTLPLHRADSLMLGVLIAVLWRSQTGKDFLVRNYKIFLYALIPLSAGAAYFAFVGTGFGEPLVHFVLAFLYADLLLLATLRPADKKNFLFDNKILEWLGLRSYGIYLLHKPFRLMFIPLLRQFSFSLEPWMNMVIVTLALFFVSELSYRLIEKPIMDLGHHIKYKKPAVEPLV